jgi:putative endonuclease
MTVSRQRLGRAAEELAARRLARAGFTILARNARVHTDGVVGEIDLVALDGSALVFVEVKAGRAGSRAGPQRPALAVDRRKQLRLRRLARAWLATAGAVPGVASLRFDVIGVQLDGTRVVAYEHLRGAF